MTFTAITAPTGATPGKTFAIHVETNLLVITNPTVADIKACRGILIVTNTGWQFALGQAFFDLKQRLETRIGREVNALTDYTTSREFAKLVKKGLGVFKASSSGTAARLVHFEYGRAGDYSTDVDTSGATAYAVPHRGVTGFGCSHAATHASGPDWYLGFDGVNANKNYTDDTVYGQMMFGPGAQGTSGAGPIIPKGFLLSAHPSAFTYEQFVEKVISTMEDSDGIRGKTRAGVKAFLVAKGIPLNTYVPIPSFVFTDGRFAFDLVNARTRYSGGRTGTDNGAGNPGDMAVPVYASRLRHSDQYYFTTPPIECAQITAGVIHKPFLDLAFDVPTDYMGATRAVPDILGGRRLAGIHGHQPAGVFNTINAGVLEKRTGTTSVPVSDEDVFRLIRWGYDVDTTFQLAAAPTVEQTAAANSLAVGTKGDGGRLSSVGHSAADSWMVTARMLTRLVLDPVGVDSSNNAVWDETVATKLMTAVNAMTASGV